MGRFHPAQALLLAACTLLLQLGACTGTATSPHRRQLLQQAAGAPPPPPAAAPSADAPPAGNGTCCQQLAAIGFSSNLPVVVLDTRGAKLEEKGKDVNITLCTCNSGQPFEDYDGLAAASVRGSTSANATKKSFAVELQEQAPAGKGGANGLKGRDFAFLGMPADKDWILYGGDEVDLTQGMRNWLAYNLARASGRYASRTVWCEVFLRDDGAPALVPAHYHGIYIGLERIKIAKHRVNVSKLQPPNLSGGYILDYENDNIEAGDVTFGPLSGWDHPFLMKDPKKAPPEALTWLAGYLQSFQDALEAPDWLSRTPGYTSLISGPDFLDYFLLTELTKNPDGYRQAGGGGPCLGSVYLHKDRDAPLAAGPAWDYNEAFGLCCGYPIEGWDKQGVSGPGQAGGSAISPEGWRFLICADQERCVVDPTDGISRWYRRMWTDPRFAGGAAARWAELRGGPWSDATLRGMITDIKPAVLRNFDRYEAVLLKPWYQNSEQEWTTEVGNLESWLLARVAWMDGEMGKQRAPGAAAAPAGRR